MRKRKTNEERSEGRRVGRNIKRLRESLDMTLREMAEDVGCSAATLCRAETGKGKTHKETLQKIKTMYGVDLYADDFMEDETVTRVLTPTQRKVLKQMDEYGEEPITLAYDVVTMIMEVLKHGKKEN